MHPDIARQIRMWDQEWHGRQVSESFGSIQTLIDFLTDELYSHYKLLDSYPFHFVAKRWIENAQDDRDKQTLLKLIPNLLFVGPEEFRALFQTAMNGPITRWLIEHSGLHLENPCEVQNTVKELLQTTWFLGITDSMDLGDFCRQMGIAQENRENISSLLRDREVEYVANTMKNQGYERIVLLEDFVGSGTQIKQHIDRILATKIPILFCPLIVCARGVECGQKLANNNPNLAFQPVLSIAGTDCIAENVIPGENEIAPSIRELLPRVFSRLKKESGLKKFGFLDTGATVVLHSNCPNNTIPIVWNDNGEEWHALFPRASRIPQ